MVADAPDQAERRARPRERRFLSTARPPRVRMRRRKPCFFLRFRLFGWKVRFTLASLDEMVGPRATRGGWRVVPPGAGRGRILGRARRWRQRGRAGPDPGAIHRPAGPSRSRSSGWGQPRRARTGAGFRRSSTVGARLEALLPSPSPARSNGLVPVGFPGGTLGSTFGRRTVRGSAGTLAPPHVWTGLWTRSRSE